MARRKIDNLRILLTGASSGIGFELAKGLLKRNAKLIVTARRDELLQQLDELAQPGQLKIVAGDITSAELRAKLIQTAQEEFGGLDALINNAGISSLGKFSLSSEELLRKVMEVNFFAPVELIRAAIPHLLQGTRPLIVNISSVLGHRAVPEKSEYCASKFALHGFSDSLRAEIAPEIDLLLVSPSTTQSEFFENAVGNHSDRDWKPKKAMSPEVVAKKAIQAMMAGKHEVILTLGAKGLVLLDRVAPTLANKLVQKFG